MIENQFIEKKSRSNRLCDDEFMIENQFIEKRVGCPGVSRPRHSVAIYSVKSG